MKREFLQGLCVGDAPLSKDVVDAIMAENGKDIQQAKQWGLAWEDKYNQAVSAHQQEVSALKLQGALQSAVLKAGGRNATAIAALLDMQSIGASEDIAGAMDDALEKLRQTDSYLFEPSAPPPYARGTGTLSRACEPVTLAGALRERSRK